MKPNKITIDSTRLSLHFEDGSREHIPIANLRRWCPCAECAEERSKEGKHFIPILSYEQTRIRGIENVGAYAIQIQWADGHRLGIYEFDYLRGLADKCEQTIITAR